MSYKCVIIDRRRPFVMWCGVRYGCGGAGCMGAVVVRGVSVVVVCAVRLCPLSTQGDIHRPGWLWDL